MSNIFFASDYHYGHVNVIKFMDNNGDIIRKFDDIDHMNEYFIMQHNRTVSPSDKIYVLGDIAMNKRYLSTLNRMNGEKVLILGNHDTENASEYLKYFKDVRAVHAIAGLLLSHIPVHSESLGRWKANVHGHLHHNIVTKLDYNDPEQRKVPDPRYYSVCMEQLDDYRPVSLEQIKKNLLERGIEI